MEKKVLVVATSRKTHGGITSVVKSHESGEQWKKFHCRWVETHRDGSAWRKVMYFIGGYIKFLVLLPFYGIVHIHLSTKISLLRKMVFIKTAKLFKKRIIVHLHCGNQLQDQWSEQYDYAFRTADVVLVLSSWIKNFINNKTKKDNIEICYNACPKAVILNDIPKKKYILYVGTIGTDKGYHILIEAFSKIAKQHENWNVKFAGIGEIQEAKVMAERLGIGKQIEMLGWVAGKEKENLFREASMLCLPSYMEGFPVCVLEAWSYGLPVVSTPVGGIPDVGKDGENIVLFDIGDVDSLSDKLKDLIENESLRKKISLNSRKLAKTIFNEETINNQLNQLYSRMSKE